jgi:hypothetical protein
MIDVKLECETEKNTKYDSDMCQDMVTHFDRCGLDQLLKCLMPIFQIAVTPRTFKRLRHLLLVFLPQIRTAVMLLLLMKDS